MRGIAASLSDKDMADLAAYYAEAKHEQSYSPPMLVLATIGGAQAADVAAGAAKAKEVCAACHQADGNSTDQTTRVLPGSTATTSRRPCVTTNPAAQQYPSWAVSPRR